MGDVSVDDRVRALVQAAREAVFNAATHSGAERIDVYLEAYDGRVEVFVRDRGRGFDPMSVAEDRHGVRDSIVARMQRHGGTAEVTSTRGAGTEIHLLMPFARSSNGDAS